jgi:hypothetical protein
MSRTDFLKTCALAAVCAGLAACGGDGGGSTGQITVGVTDSPVDYAEAVVVQFTGVELKPKEGAPFSIDFTEPKTIDLRALEGEDRVLLLDGEEVPAGEYTWMRLKVVADPDVAGDSWVTIDGADCELRIPSGDERGLQLIRGFTVGVGAITDFTVDFNLRHSVIRPPGQTTEVPVCDGQAYMLKPVLRVVDNLEVGTISGTVDPTFAGEQCGTTTTGPYPGNVYLFGPVTETNLGTPDDSDGIWDDPNGDDPIATAMVDENTLSYTIGFVPAGSYRVAYTCDNDEPDVDADEDNVPTTGDEVVEFTPADGVEVAVTAGQDTAVNFPPP